MWFYVPIAHFFVQGIFGLFPMYIPPLFPVSVRATGAGFCLTNIGRVVAAGGTVVFGLMAKVGGLPSLAFLRRGSLYSRHRHCSSDSEPDRSRSNPESRRLSPTRTLPSTNEEIEASLRSVRFARLPAGSASRSSSFAAASGVPASSRARVALRISNALVSVRNSSAREFSPSAFVNDELRFQVFV